MVSDQPKVVVVQRDCLQNTSVTIRKKKYINKKCGIVCEIFRKGGGGRLISTRRWNRGGKRGRRICNSAWNNRRNARVVNQLPLWRVRISWQRPRDPGSSQDLWIVFECARSWEKPETPEARREREKRALVNLVLLGKESRLVSTWYTSLTVRNYSKGCG